MTQKRSNKKRVNISPVASALAIQCLKASLEKESSDSQKQT